MPVAVQIHPSQFPAAIEEAFCASLQSRRMNHKFHYDTAKQALRWLRVHEAFSPARLDLSCQAAYDLASVAAVRLVGAGDIDVVSLGCGSGQKESGLLRALRALHPARRVRHVPTDVSVSLTLIARGAALAAGVSPADCAPLVLDLAVAEDWNNALQSVLTPGVQRVVTFFGMLPNFSPTEVLPRLAGLLRPNDVLLVSANLAPGKDYTSGVRRILPSYDNALTGEWLFSVLGDLGVAHDDGRMEFQMVPCPEGSGLLRVEADFVFRRACSLHYCGREWRCKRGERFGLFFSYRHTPEQVRKLFLHHGLLVRSQWLNSAGDEGVFLVQR
ncbi:MAG: L-histidine N(alpha)-methyltransferase [Verrucomicrobia bacterium]|nr:L-histidine N(alpha)-methyltransferase [Verrucomicrobiota bacterium]